jgi:hypothetical protein
MIKEQFKTKKFRWTLISILIITPIGFLSKFYQGPAASWVNDSLGGVFYEIFWCLVAFLFFPNSKPWKIATTILIVTCLLEFMQLWHPPFLQAIRSNFIGVTILGDSFTMSDFPYYFVGSGIGWVWLRWIKTQSLKKQIGCVQD